MRKRDMREVLNSPFSFDVHNETFVNYCEVVICEDGTIVYGTPSHTACLERMYRERFGSDPAEDCPKEFYADYMGWLADKLNACIVYTDFHSKPRNRRQEIALRRLQMHGCCNFANK